MKNDFKDITIYVGMDVHDKSWELQFLSEHASLKNIRFSPPSCDSFVKLLNTHYPNANFICAYEASYCGFWICHELTKRGIECKVINPGDIPITQKYKERKTDKIDCQRIAHYLRSGEVQGIFVPDRQSLIDRGIVRHRFKVHRSLVKQKNRIRSHIKFYGYQIPYDNGVKDKYWSYRMIDNINEFAVKQKDLALQLEIEDLVALRKMAFKALKQVHQLAKEAKYQQNVVYLTSIKGIGILTAMLLLTELVDIKRFKNLDHLASYCGLAPRIKASGESEKNLGLVNRCNKLIRPNLIQSAWSSVRYDPTMSLYLEKQCRDNKMKSQLAIIKVAKKILSRVQFVLINQKAIAA